jgi:hypothetical protein
MLEKLDLPQSLLRFLFRHRLRQPFAFLTKHHVFVADFPDHGSTLIAPKKFARGATAEALAGLIPDAPTFFRARANKND